MVVDFHITLCGLITQLHSISLCEWIGRVSKVPGLLELHGHHRVDPNGSLLPEGQGVEDSCS